MSKQKRYEPIRDIRTDEFVDSMPNEESARCYLEKRRRRGVVACPHCKSARVSHCDKPQPYRCKDCRRHFSAGTGTVIAQSSNRLQKFVYAIYLFTIHRKGISGARCGVRYHSKVCLESCSPHPQGVGAKWRSVRCTGWKSMSIQRAATRASRLRWQKPGRPLQVRLDRPFLQLVPDSGRQFSKLPALRASRTASNLLYAIRAAGLAQLTRCASTCLTIRKNHARRFQGARVQSWLVRGMASKGMECTHLTPLSTSGSAPENRFCQPNASAGIIR